MDARTGVMGAMVRVVAKMVLQIWEPSMIAQTCVCQCLMSVNSTVNCVIGVISVCILRCFKTDGSTCNASSGALDNPTWVQGNNGKV